MHSCMKTSDNDQKPTKRPRLVDFDQEEQEEQNGDVARPRLSSEHTEIVLNNSISQTTAREGDEQVGGVSLRTMSRRDDESHHQQGQLQRDLEEVERTLQEQRGATSGNQANHSGLPFGAGGAVFESLSSALGSIRRRFQQQQRNPTTADAEASSNDIPATDDDFSQRLATLERAHSARIPLQVLRNQQEHQQQEEGKTFDEDDETVASAVERKKAGRSHNGNESDGTTHSASTSSSQQRRRASTLVASRRYANAQETNEIALHEDAAMAATMAIMSEEENGKGEIDEASKNQIQFQQQHETEEEEDTHFVLPAASLQKMHAATHSHHGTVLGLSNNPPSPPPLSSMTREASAVSAGGESIASFEPAPAPTLYEWGLSPDFNLAGPHGSSDIPENEKSKTRTPTQLPKNSRVGRSEIVSVSVGESHIAMASTTGSLLICGNNTEGAVDPSQPSVASLPRPMHLESIMTLTTRVLQVACGLDHTAILTENRAVLTFGNNMDGQLGHRAKPRSNNNRFQAPAAMVLPPGRKAAQIACGHRFTLVLTTRMQVYMCGRSEITGCSGEIAEEEEESCTISSTNHLAREQPALQGLPLVYVAAGESHAVVVTAHGTAYAWGDNPTGACGREFPKSLSVPVPVQVPASSFALPTVTRSDPTAVRQRPNSPFFNWAAWEAATPNLISLADDVAVVDAACGKDTTILVTKMGSLLVAGSNNQGQLGLSYKEYPTSISVRTVPHPQSDRAFVSAQAGVSHTLLLDSEGDVWWMGTGSATIQPLLEGQSIKTIAAGGNYSFMIAATDVDGKDISAIEIKLPSSPTKLGLEGLLDGIFAEKETVKQATAIQDLTNQTEELFRCPAVMNSFFLDPKEIDDMYFKLIDATTSDQAYQQKVVSAIERGMTKGLEFLREARLMYPEAVRCLLLYLQCPLFRKNDNPPTFDFDGPGDLILLLCESILGLPFEGFKAFTSWTTSLYARDLFVPFLVQPLKDQLNHWIESKRTRAVPGIVGVLRWFQNLSERFPDDLDSTPEDFYSLGVENLSMEELFGDLIRYKQSTKGQRSTNFFLCASPFIMSPRCKQNLLQIESQMTMVRAAQAGGVQFDAARRQFLFNPYFVMAIDRQYMLQQTLQAVACAAPGELRKSLKVVFKGEDGVDAGGVTKEFFQLLVVQLFDINTGMWSTDFGDGLHTWFNADCTWNQDGYYLVGILVGLAFYNSVILDVHFPQAIYRKLLGLPLGLEDMVDPEVQRGLQQLLDYEGDDIEDIFCLTFEVTWNSLGMERKKELKSGGANIPVNNDNKEEYVMLYVKWLLVDSVQSQYHEFERGFMQVMDGSSLDLLRPEELELLVVGTPELDFDALERNTEYEGGFEKESAVVKNLWRFVREAPRDDQLKFLKFTTGTTKAPIGGLGAMPFKVQRAGPDSTQLPTSHTCFNTLLVPDYGDDFEKLKNRLGRAIIECEGFGLQ